MIANRPPLAPGEYLGALTWSRFARPASAPRGIRYTVSGRDALALALGMLELGPEDVVLIPAWICASVAEAVERVGARCEWYDVQSNGDIDVATVTRRLGARTRVVLAVHYFGFPQALGPLVSACDALGVPVIEDCAHAWLTAIDGRPVGGRGAAAIYSIRKFLPLPEGGALQLNASFPRRTPVDGRIPPSLGRWARIQKDLVEQLFSNPDARGHGQDARVIDSWGWGARGGTPGWRQRSLQARPHEEAAGPRVVAGCRPTRVVERIICLADRRRIVSARRWAYRRLDEGVRKLPQVKPFFPSLPDGVCPWGFPFVADHRVGLDRALRREGIQVFTFGDPVSGPHEAESFPIARRLREQVLLLPCHQGLGDREIRAILSAMERAGRDPTR